MRRTWTVNRELWSLRPRRYGAGLLLQERLVAMTPDRIRGQALGLFGTGLMSFQAVGATLAGIVARTMPVADAIGVMAVLSLLVSAALTPGLRLPVPLATDTEAARV